MQLSAQCYQLCKAVWWRNVWGQTPNVPPPHSLAQPNVPCRPCRPSWQLSLQPLPSLEASQACCRAEVRPELRYTENSVHWRCQAHLSGAAVLKSKGCFALPAGFASLLQSRGQTWTASH